MFAHVAETCRMFKEATAFENLSAIWCLLCIEDGRAGAVNTNIGR